MAQLGTRFDPTAHDTTQRDYEDLPLGIYQFEMSASDIVPTSAGTGTILKATFTVVAPEELKNRILFNNYNLENPNPQAQQIGQAQFASLCRAIGIDGIEDSEELHFRVFTAKLGMGKASKGKDGKEYPPRPEIKKYFFPDEGNVPEPAVDAVQPAARAEPVARVQAPANDNREAQRPAAAAATGGGSRPWGPKR